LRIESHAFTHSSNQQNRLQDLDVYFNAPRPGLQGDDYHDFFLADGLHPETVAQGIIADLFLNAFNDHFGTAVQPLSPAEIVRYAARVQYRIRHNGPRA
jgi:hypothetical protein